MVTWKTPAVAYSIAAASLFGVYTLYPATRQSPEVQAYHLNQNILAQSFTTSVIENQKSIDSLRHVFHTARDSLTAFQTQNPTLLQEYQARQSRYSGLLALLCLAEAGSAIVGTAGVFRLRAAQK